MKEYRPLPKELTIHGSTIDGLGVFSTTTLSPGIIFMSHPTHRYLEKECLRINFGGFINHSRNPSAEIIEVDGKGYLKIIKEISADTEITADYSKTKCGSYLPLIESNAA